MRAIRAGFGGSMVALLLAAMVLGLSACGSSDDGGGGGGSTSASSSGGDPVKLTVQLLPLNDVVPVYLGMRKGFFREAGLELDVQTASGGAEIVPSVLSGSTQIGYSNIPSLLIAAQKGLPIEIIAPANGGQPRLQSDDPEGKRMIEGIMVTRDSPIRRPADLAGKTIAVNELHNISEVTTRASLEAQGVDTSGIRFLEVPLPDMAATLEAGRVDAAFLPSPFKAQAEATGNYRSLMFPGFEVMPGLNTTAYFVARKWAEENPEVLDRFLGALRKSMEYADAHEDEMRQELTTYTRLTRDILPIVPIGARTPSCDTFPQSVDTLGRLLVRYGVIDAMPDETTLVRPGFCDGASGAAQ